MRAAYAMSAKNKPMEAGSPRSAAVDSSRTPRPLTVSLVGGAQLPLAFILLGLFAFVVACGWLVCDPALLLEPFLNLRVVALVHLWLPGFLLSITLGAFYQLMPVVLGAPLQAGSVGIWSHFGAHALGIPVLVAGFVIGRYEWVGIGGLCIGAGILFLMTATWRTFRLGTRRDAAAWSFPLSASWLSITVVFGIALALNRRWPFLPLSAVDLLRAHAHLGLAGFFLTLLQGATFQLVPMFTMGDARRPRFIWSGLIFTQAGLLLLAPGFAWNIQMLIATGALVLALGIACSGFALLATVRARRRKKLEPGLRSFLCGATLLLPAAGIGVAMTLVETGSIEVTRVTSVYGALIIPGALSLMILGMLCKIVPFLVWMRAYGPLVGKRPVPVATELSLKPLESGWAIAHTVALGLIVAACAARSPFYAGIGTWTLAAAALVFLINIARILNHLRRPTPAPPRLT
jgi:hypothetical protein